MTILTRCSQALRLQLVLGFAAGACLSACADDDADADTELSPSTGTGGPRGSSGPSAGRKSDRDDAGSDKSAFSFFVTSETSKTGDLGGLKGADERCAKLAKAVGAGDRTWRAYLSTEHGAKEDDGPIHARDRIGDGPWYNVAGELIASDLKALHSRKGNADLFLDERGKKINGQWIDSPKPNEHDVLTGSTAEGTVFAGKTCADWTSDSADLRAQVGHIDGLGPNQATSGTYTSWNSAHESAGCNDTAPRGGAGRFYCFAAD